MRQTTGKGMCLVSILRQFVPYNLRTNKTHTTAKPQPVSLRVLVIFSYYCTRKSVCTHNCTVCTVRLTNCQLLRRKIAQI